MKFEQAMEEMIKGKKVKLPEINAAITLNGTTFVEQDFEGDSFEIEGIDDELKSREDWEVFE
jgi:hypothetical protein